MKKPEVENLMALSLQQIITHLMVIVQVQGHTLLLSKRKHEIILIKTKTVF